MTHENIVQWSKWLKVSYWQEKLQKLISAPQVAYFLVPVVQYTSTVDFFKKYKKRHFQLQWEKGL